MAMACSRGSGNRSTCVGSGCDLLIVLVVIGLSEISLWIIAREKGLQRSLMRFIISADVPISTYPLQMRLLLFNSELSEMPPENAVLFDLSGPGRRQRKLSPSVSPRADLLQLRQLRIGLLYHLSMVVILERTRLRPPTQLFQPLSHLIPARFASLTTFTVWAVDSQEGQ